MIASHMRRMRPSVLTLSKAARMNSAHGKQVAFGGASRAAFAAQMPFLSSASANTMGVRCFSVESMSNMSPVPTDPTVVDSASSALEQVSAAAEKIDVASISDLGYGLTDMAVRLLDVVHATTGLPWWATIMATTIAARTILFPLSVYSLRNSARMRMAMPELSKLREEMNASATGYTSEQAADVRRRHAAICKKYDINPMRGMLVPFAQIPVFISFFWGLQELPKYFPDYMTGGALWFNDLSAADPYMALPIMSSALVIASVELGGEGMDPETMEKMKFGMRCFSLILIPLTMKFQTGLFVYWMTSSVFAVGQGLVIKNPAVKRLLNIPTENAVTTTVLNTPSAQAKGVVSPFQAAIDQLKKQTDNNVQTHVYRQRSKPSAKN